MNYQNAAHLVQQLLAELARRGVHHGREDSFKLGPGRLLAGRVLIGVETAGLACDQLLAIATALGMPAAGLAPLQARADQANAVFFGFEDSPDGCMCKVYLEFWEQVRAAILRAPSRAPQLLHYGIKWNSAQPQRHEVARYDVHPLLDGAAIVRRMAACFGQATPLSALTQEIVQMAAQRRPQASMLYLEVSEANNPRASFDVNLYKSGLLVADCAAQLRAAATGFGLGQALEAPLAQLGACPFGHLSAGMDRRGQPFLSVYGERLALS